MDRKNERQRNCMRKMGRTSDIVVEKMTVSLEVCGSMPVCSSV